MAKAKTPAAPKIVNIEAGPIFNQKREIVNWQIRLGDDARLFQSAGRMDRALVLVIQHNTRQTGICCHVTRYGDNGQALYKTKNWREGGAIQTAELELPKQHRPAAQPAAQSSGNTPPKAPAAGPSEKAQNGAAKYQKFAKKFKEANPAAGPSEIGAAWQAHKAKSGKGSGKAPAAPAAPAATKAGPGDKAKAAAAKYQKWAKAFKAANPGITKEQLKAAWAKVKEGKAPTTPKAPAAPAAPKEKTAEQKAAAKAKAKAKAAAKAKAEATVIGKLDPIPPAPKASTGNTPAKPTGNTPAKKGKGQSPEAAKALAAMRKWIADWKAAHPKKTHKDAQAAWKAKK